MQHRDKIIASVGILADFGYKTLSEEVLKIVDDLETEIVTMKFRLEGEIKKQARSELSKEIADYLQSSIAAFGEDRTEITNHKDAYDWLRDDVENLIEDLTK